MYRQVHTKPHVESTKPIIYRMLIMQEWLRLLSFTMTLILSGTPIWNEEERRLFVLTQSVFPISPKMKTSFQGPMQQEASLADGMDGRHRRWTMVKQAASGVHEKFRLQMTPWCSSTEITRPHRKAILENDIVSGHSTKFPSNGTTDTRHGLFLVENELQEAL